MDNTSFFFGSGADEQQQRSDAAAVAAAAAAADDVVTVEQFWDTAPYCQSCKKGRFARIDGGGGLCLPFASANLRCTSSSRVAVVDFKTDLLVVYRERTFLSF